MENLDKKITIKIKLQNQENEYEINFPTNGQIIDIEALRMSLGKGTTDQMLYSKSRSTNLAYITIETIATFTILIPELIEDLRVKSLLDLDPIESKVVRDAYIDQFYPWYHDWLDFINKPVESKSSESVDEEEIDDDEK